MRIHDVWLVDRNDGEEFELYDNEEEALSRMIEIIGETEGEVSEMMAQLYRSAGEYSEDPYNTVRVIYVS